MAKMFQLSFGEAKIQNSWETTLASYFKGMIHVIGYINIYDFRSTVNKCTCHQSNSPLKAVFKGRL